MLYKVSEKIEDVRKRMIAGDDKTGLKTGFIDLDYLNGGLKKKDLIVLGARPSMGKTSLMLNILDHIGINSGKTCILFFMETTADYCIKRLLNQRANIEGMTKMLDDEHMSRLSNAVEDTKRGNIFIDDTAGASVKYIREQCFRIKEDQELGKR